MWSKSLNCLTLFLMLLASIPQAHSQPTPNWTKQREFLVSDPVGEHHDTASTSVVSEYRVFISLSKVMTGAGTSIETYFPDWIDNAYTLPTADYEVLVDLSSVRVVEQVIRKTIVIQH